MAWLGWDTSSFSASMPRHYPAYCVPSSAIVRLAFPHLQSLRIHASALTHTTQKEKICNPVRVGGYVSECACFTLTSREGQFDLLSQRQLGAEFPFVLTLF